MPFRLDKRLGNKILEYKKYIIKIMFNQIVINKNYILPNY